MQPLGGCFNLFMLLDIFQQVEAELIQPQIHDGDTAAHILNVHHFLLQPLELRTAVFQIAFFLGVDQVIIAGGGHDRDFHAGFNTGFQVDVFIQIHIRPEVDELDMVIFAADTVNSPETLNDADRVPVNVVVDEIVAVLQVLTFGNTVGGNQNVKLILASGHQDSFPFRDRGETGQDSVEVGAELWNGGFAVHCAGDFSRFQTEFLFGKLADIRIEIIRRVGKSGEDDDFPIAGVDGMFDFLLDQVEQCLQLGIMLRRNIGNHQAQQFQIFCVLFQLPLPRNIVHIGKVDSDFLPNREISRCSGRRNQNPRYPTVLSG